MIFIKPVYKLSIKKKMDLGLREAALWPCTLLKLYILLINVNINVNILLTLYK